MKIGIIILNWNGKALLEKYLPHVIQHSAGHTVYVADNASTDESVAYLETNFNEVQLIKLDDNYGYAGGYNKAIALVEEELICLLNNDVRVTNGWLDPIIDSFKNNKIAALQPLLLSDVNSEYYDYAGAAGGFLDRYAYPYCRGRIFSHIEREKKMYRSSVDLDWASGACLFVRKSIYNEVGGLDEKYFAHQEEIDLCWRMRHAGYTISIAPDSRVYHLGGGTLDSASPRKSYYNFRNSLFNIVKNDHSSWWILILIIRMKLDGLAALHFLILGKGSHFIAVLKAHFSFYSHLNYLFKKRQYLMSTYPKSKVKYRDLSIVIQHFVLGKKTYGQLDQH